MAETGTALGIVEEQQAIVGDALVGASGSAVLAESTDSQSQILEQIRDIQLKTLRGIGEVVSTMKDIFDLDKLQDRRAKEDQTELDKENLNLDGAGGDDGGKISPQDADKASGGIFGFFGALPGAGMLKKLFLPITAFFGKSGLLVKLFGKFGPLGALIIGFTLLYKYSDEISKALAPALDKIKELFVKLEPAIEVLKQIGDFLMKGIIEGIGEAITFLLGTVELFIDGITKIFEGDVMGGLNDIFEGIVRTILAVPLTIINFLKPLFLDIIDYIAEPWNNMVTNVNQYISDTFTAISDYFVELKDNIVGFFVDAYNTVKTTITDAVQGAFNFISDIFNSISDFMSSAYTKAKNFVTSLPDRILGFISNMFSPIIDFFNAIGNRIKTTINGVIDALPLPNFVKDKIKFDVEPSQDQLDKQTDGSFEKLEAPKVDEDGIKLDKSLFDDIDKHKDAIQEYMEETGARLDLKGSRYLYDKGTPVLRFENTDGSANIVSAEDFSDGPAKEIAAVKNYQANKLANTADSVMNEDDLYDEGMGNGATTTIVNNNTNVDNSSVASQTDVHSGSLDTGVDTYHDKLAYGSA
jgi:hypothetical protein